MKKQNKTILNLLVAAFVVVAFIIFFIWILSAPITYATPTNATEGIRYKYVTERTEKAVYIGENTFYTEDGNAWKYDGNFKKGKTYILKIHDNGTKNNIKDDVIVSIN